MDENTREECHHPFTTALEFEATAEYVLPPGEQTKSLETAKTLYDFLLGENFDRDCVIVNLGGGVITDLGGFVASTYKRGVRLVNVPTTLLSMVDASFGGKNGVNVGELKNQVGTFYHPAYVMFDLYLPGSLKEEELRSGFTEMLKHALIADAEHWKQLRALDDAADVLEHEKLLKRSVEIKCTIVESDPREGGERKKLNFGHSIGHAVEALYSKRGKEMRHGEAVGVGILCESLISHELGMINDAELKSIKSCIDYHFDRLPIGQLEADRLVEYMKHDKKNKDGKLNFTLLQGIGNARIDCFCEEGMVKDVLLKYESL